MNDHASASAPEMVSVSRAEYDMFLREAVHGHKAYRWALRLALKCLDGSDPHSREILLLSLAAHMGLRNAPRDVPGLESAVRAEMDRQEAGPSQHMPFAPNATGPDDHEPFMTSRSGDGLR